MKNDSNSYEAPRVDVIRFNGDRIATNEPYYTGGSGPAVIGYGPDGNPDYLQNGMKTHTNDDEEEIID